MPVKVFQQEEKLKDFRVFLFYIWKHLRLPDPTPLQYDISLYLQNGPKRKVVEAFRGVGKSWVTSAYVLYRLYWNPQLKILVVSASKERADSFSTFTLRLINEIDWLRQLKPNAAKGQRNSKLSFDVGPARPDHSPSVKSVGIFGQLTGSRADIIVADDVEVANNSFTQTMRDKISEAVKEFDAILKPDDGAEITYLGTPQTEMSLYNILGERGYACHIWPARVPDIKRRKWYGDRLAPIISAMTNIGHSTDPTRFSDRDLMEREASYGRSGFALQYMLDTSLTDREKFPLRCMDFSVMSLNPELAPEKIIWAAGQDNKIPDLNNLGFNGDAFYAPMAIQGDWRPYEQSLMYIDPSGRGADETAWVILKSQGVNIFLMSAGGHKFGYEDEGMELLYKEAVLFDVQKICIESNFGDGMFTKMFTSFLIKKRNESKAKKQKEYMCGIEETRSNKQKELRMIDTCEPVMNQHRVIVDRRVIEKDFADTQDACKSCENGFAYSLFYQLTHVTKERGALVHDDRGDAFAGCLAQFCSLMENDQDTLIKNNRQRDRDAELEAFADYSSTGLFDMVLITGDARHVVDKLGRGSSTDKLWVET